MIWLTALGWLKRVPRFAWGIAGAVVFVVGAAWQYGAWLERRDKVSYDRGFNAAEFDGAIAAGVFSHRIAALEADLAVKQVATNHAVEQALALRARANAATAALEASIRNLSATAVADTTVRTLTNAAHTLAKENAALSDSVVAIRNALAAERTTMTVLHTVDTVAIREVSPSGATVRGELAVERAKPRRTAKAMVVAGAVGGVVVEGARFVLTRFRKGA